MLDILAVLCKQGVVTPDTALLGWSDFGLTTLRNDARQREATRAIQAGQPACPRSCGLVTHSTEQKVVPVRVPDVFARTMSGYRFATRQQSNA